MQQMCKYCKCKHQSYAESVYADCFEFAEFKPWVPSTGDADGRIVVRVGGLGFTHFQLEAPQNWISDVGTFNASQNLQYLKSLKSFILYQSPGILELGHNFNQFDLIPKSKPFNAVQPAFLFLSRMVYVYIFAGVFFVVL